MSVTTKTQAERQAAYEQALRDLAAFRELQRLTVLQECGEAV